MGIKVNIAKAIQKITQASKVPQQVVQDTYKVFYDKTPVKTGNARRNTRLKGKTIEANYPYAGVLDKGRHLTAKGMRGSRQASRGMSKPALEYLRRQLKKRIGKKNG